MASLAHVSVGLAAGKLRGRTWASMLIYPALALLPDADVVAFAFHIPYSDQFGHRGASHSLAFAALISVSSLAAFRGGFGRAATVFAVVASHPLLDMLTDGGLGCAVFWPFTAERFFFPWRPIPVAPIGAGMFSLRGASVLAVEFVATLPLIGWSLIKSRSGFRQAQPDRVH